MKRALVSLILATTSAVSGAAGDADVFPMAVWYGGGKARAPMLEASPRAAGLVRDESISY